MLMEHNYHFLLKNYFYRKTITKYAKKGTKYTIHNKNKYTCSIIILK